MGNLILQITNLINVSQVTTKEQKTRSNSVDIIHLKCVTRNNDTICSFETYFETSLIVGKHRWLFLQRGYKTEPEIVLVLKGSD